MIIIFISVNNTETAVFLFSIDWGVPLAFILVVTAFIGILIFLSFLIFLVEDLLVCFDTFLILRFTTILDGINAATIEIISIKNSSGTGSIYFSVDSRPLSN